MGEPKIQQDGKKGKKPYLMGFDHKQVVLKVVDGTKFKGKLHTRPDCPYEVVIQNEGSRILIFKHSIISIELID